MAFLPTPATTSARSRSRGPAVPGQAGAPRSVAVAMSERDRDIRDGGLLGSGFRE